VPDLCSLFEEKNADAITLKAMGRAINKTVTIAEVLRRRIPNLYQIIELNTVDLLDRYMPVEEGLQTVESAHDSPERVVKHCRRKT